jgi:hypothetical protein
MMVLQLQVSHTAHSGDHDARMGKQRETGDRDAGGNGGGGFNGGRGGNGPPKALALGAAIVIPRPATPTSCQSTPVVPGRVVIAVVAVVHGLPWFWSLPPARHVQGIHDEFSSEVIGDRVPDSLAIAGG